MAETLRQEMQDVFDSCIFPDAESAIRDFYTRFEMHLTHYKIFRVFSDFLLACVSKYDCNNMQLVLEIVRANVILHDYDISRTFNQNRWRSCGAATDCEEERLSIIKRIVFDNYHADEFISWEREGLLTADVYENSDYNLMNCLVRYRITALPFEDIFDAYWFRQWIIYTSKQFGKIYEDLLEPWGQLVRYWHLCETPARRKSLVIKTMECIISHQLVNTDVTDDRIRSKKNLQILEKVKILDLLSHSIPELLVTVTDIWIFCNLFFQNPIHRIFYENIFETFNTLFPKSTEHYQPRSLMDLARCKVRNCVPEDASLPGQLSNLVLSDSVRDFILFKDRKQMT